MFCAMSNRLVLAGLLLAGVVAAVWVWSRIRYDFRPKRLVTVEEGFVYRSGQISARLIGRVLDEKGIDTVVSLVGYDPARPDHVAEKAAVDARGIRFVNVNLHGNGTGDPERYLEALLALHQTREAGGQALVHCASGVRRAAGVVAVYRVLLRGDEPARVAREELDRFVGPAGLWGPRPAVESQIVGYLNEHMALFARRLVEEGALAEVPTPIPRFPMR